MIEVVKFTPEEIEEAIDGLDGLQEIIVPMLKKANYEGMAEEDMKQFKKHITMSKHALLAMSEFIEEKTTFEKYQKTEQWLNDIDNPLEPIKLRSALDSEILKFEYRKKHDPNAISVLDYTIISALIKLLKTKE